MHVRISAEDVSHVLLRAQHHCRLLNSLGGAVSEMTTWGVPVVGIACVIGGELISLMVLYANL